MLSASSGVRAYFYEAAAQVPLVFVTKKQETTTPNPTFLSRKQCRHCFHQVGVTTRDIFRQHLTVTANTGNSSASSYVTKNYAAIRLKLHVVKSGDTLSSVAQRYGVSLKQLRQTNGRIGVHEVTLRIGEVLYLPIRDFTRVDGFSGGNTPAIRVSSSLWTLMKYQIMAWVKRSLASTSAVPSHEEYPSLQHAHSRKVIGNHLQLQSSSPRQPSNLPQNAPRFTRSSYQAGKLHFASLQSHLQHIRSPFSVLPGWAAVAAAAVAASILVIQVWKLLSMSSSSSNRDSGSNRNRTLMGRGQKVSSDVKESRRMLNRFGLPREELRHVLGLPDSMRGSELAGVALAGVLRVGEEERGRMNVWGEVANASSLQRVQEDSNAASKDDQLGGVKGDYDWLTRPSPRFTSDAQAVMGSSFREVLQSQRLSGSELSESESSAGEVAEKIELGEWSVGMAKDANARVSGT